MHTYAYKTIHRHHTRKHTHTHKTHTCNCEGLVGHYTVEELALRLVVVLCNLKPRPMKFIADDYASHGMVLCATTDGACV